MTAVAGNSSADLNLSASLASDSGKPIFFNDGKSVTADNKDEANPSSGTPTPRPSSAAGSQNGAGSSSRPGTAQSGAPGNASRPGTAQTGAPANASRPGTAHSGAPPASPTSSRPASRQSEASFGNLMNADAPLAEMPKHLQNKEKELRALKSAAPTPVAGTVANAYASAAAAVDKAQMSAADKRSGFEQDKYALELFEKWDLNHDDMISIDEFGADLFNIFVKYCSFGKGSRHEQMGSHQFSKLCRDCKLVNGTTEEVGSHQFSKLCHDCNLG
eukprot:gene9953-7829_t